MSKLRENPAKIVPVRTFLIALVLTVVIVGSSRFLDFELLQTLVFFWLATIANLMAFKLIVVGAIRLTEKQVEVTKTAMAPNLLIRYVMYIGVMVAAWFIGGPIPSIAALMGIQMSQIAIKLDALLG